MKRITRNGVIALLAVTLLILAGCPQPTSSKGGGETGLAVLTGLTINGTSVTIPAAVSNDDWANIAAADIPTTEVTLASLTGVTVQATVSEGAAATYLTSTTKPSATSSSFSATPPSSFNDNAYLYIRVTNSDAGTRNFYRVQIKNQNGDQPPPPPPPGSVVLSGLKIGGQTVTVPAAVSAADWETVELSAIPTASITLTSLEGVTVEPTVAEDATVTYAKTAKNAAAKPTDFGTLPTSFEDEDYLYIKVTNGDNANYYRVQINEEEPYVPPAPPEPEASQIMLYITGITPLNLRIAYAVSPTSDPILIPINSTLLDTEASVAISTGSGVVPSVSYDGEDWSEGSYVPSYGWMFPIDLTQSDFIVKIVSGEKINYVKYRIDPQTQTTLADIQEEAVVQAIEDLGKGELSENSDGSYTFVIEEDDEIHIPFISYEDDDPYVQDVHYYDGNGEELEEGYQIKPGDIITIVITTVVEDDDGNFIEVEIIIKVEAKKYAPPINWESPANKPFAITIGTGYKTGEYVEVPYVTTYATTIGNYTPPGWLGSAHTAALTIGTTSNGANRSNMGYITLRESQMKNVEVHVWLPEDSPNTVKIVKVSPALNAAVTTAPLATFTSATEVLEQTTFTGRDYLQVQYTTSTGTTYYSIYIRKAVDIPYVAPSAITLSNTDVEAIWEDAAEIELDRTSNDACTSLTSFAGWSLADRSSHTFIKLFWSDDGLYYLANVVDSVITSNTSSTSSNTHTYDSIEAFLYEAYAFQSAGANWTASGGQYRVSHDNAITGDTTSRITSSASHTDTGYVIKARIGFAAADTTAVNGHLIGLEFANNACNGTGGNGTYGNANGRVAQIIWNAWTAPSYQNYGNCGLAYLYGKP